MLQIKGNHHMPVDTAPKPDLSKSQLSKGEPFADAGINSLKISESMHKAAEAFKKDVSSPFDAAAVEAIKNLRRAA